MSVNITLDDLIGVCPECRGGGQKPQESTGGGKGGYGYGRHVIATYGDDRCPRCLGTGRWGLTETGKALFEFTTIVGQLKERGLLG